MFFRNLTLFRFAENLPRPIKKLPSSLDEHRLRSPGPIELATRGDGLAYDTSKTTSR